MRPTRIRLGAVVAALAAMIAGVTGCGTSSSSGEPASPVELFSSAAQQVCADANAQLSQLPQARTQQEIAAVTQQIVQLRGQAEQRFRAIDPPAVAEAGYTRFVDLFAQQTRYYAEIANLLAAGRRAAARKVADRSRREIALQNDIVRRLGLAACG